MQIEEADMRVVHPHTATPEQKERYIRDTIRRLRSPQERCTVERCEKNWIVMRGSSKRLCATHAYEVAKSA